MSSYRKIWLATLTAAAVLGFAASSDASSLLSGFSKNAVLKDLRTATADHWSVSGGNIVVSGNVFIPAGDYEIRADEAIINPESRDFDAKGNLTLFHYRTIQKTVTIDELIELQNNSDLLVEITGTETDVFGNQKTKVKVRALVGSIHAETLSGNLATGYFQFHNAVVRLFDMVCRAESGERLANGITRLKNAQISTCNYLESENAHYSLQCGSAEISPYNTENFDHRAVVADHNEYSLLASNCTVRAYGVPIFWLPFAYKPKNETLGLFQMHGGRDSDWGIFISLSKKYQLADYPDTTARIYSDYFEKRGFGYGVRIRSNMENSKTEFFAYGLYDKERYESNDPRKYGIRIPYQRFDFRLSNVTHITPTLDFRANLEWLSDEYFTDDFFHDHYSANPQPVTFAALEQQWEHATASIYIRPQINDFFTTVEQLPTIQLNVQRQELFDSNIYYQGDHSVGYLQRRWRDFNNRKQYKAPYDYHSGRVDSVNFLYYPLNFDLINIIPRAGVRLTGYSETSENPISDEELALLLNSSNPSFDQLWTEDYDGKGDSELRFIAEFGVEVNTKIYRTWQDIRSDWLQLDGLRHIIVPYLNYTFIPEPTGDREKLYYFDDIDRIDEQHFVRFGVINRLQTRRNDQLVNYLVMENYIDLHLEDEDGFNHVGDFCTRLSMSPLKGLTLSTFFSVDAGDNDKIGDDDQTVIRRGRDAGHPGLYLDWLNRWEVTLRYEPIQDFVFTMNYNYQNRHRTRSAYSMGSSLDDIESGGSFTRYYLTQTQEISLGVRAPLTPDRRTFGAYTITYDVNAGYISNQTLALVRQFHCWEVAAELSFDTDYDSDGDKDRDTSFYITAYLTGLTGPLRDKQSSLMSTSRNLQTL